MARLWLRPFFADCTPVMKIMQDEIFGPVVAVAPFDSVEEAVAHVNSSPYGLCASLWTTNVAGGYGSGQPDQDRNCLDERAPDHFLRDALGWLQAIRLGKDLSTMVLEEYVMTKHIYVDLTGQAEKPCTAFSSSVDAPECRESLTDRTLRALQLVRKQGFSTAWPRIKGGA